MNFVGRAQSTKPTPDRRAGTDLAARFERVRGRTLELISPITAEDAVIQSMADASPAKWHLAHTTWFFERFVLGRLDGHRPLHPEWDYLFNSYYRGVGSFHARPRRGLLSRPSLAEVLEYRVQVEEKVLDAIEDHRLDEHAIRILQVGLQHEQQHQELILTDIKHALSCNPLLQPYRQDLPTDKQVDSGPLTWERFDEGIVSIGAPVWPEQTDAFAYDNESPPHRVLVGSFALASRPVTCGEFREFIRDDGYSNPLLWLSDGWDLAQAECWQSPLYWIDEDSEYTLGGVRAIDLQAPVCHLSYYEADAFARWAGSRLPTEFEWETAAARQGVHGNFVETGCLHPAASPGTHLRQMFGDVWEWTSSAYLPYPGFRPMPGTLGEYNGKFMCGPWVLRGGSCASPSDHLRATYRNFFAPPARWQFSGLRLARNGHA